ncbi:MAG: hypothetical protein GTO44_10015 [Hydrotalea flava]|nr:hypothetical protein [Hydrotalea flava]NIN15388.1 hypothetical protein [Hydrotalea flava]
MKQNLLKLWPLAATILFLASLSSVPMPDAFGQSFGELCFEDVDNLCGIGTGNASDVFSGVLEPLESQIGFGVATGFGFVIFWAGIFSIVWFKTENIMVIGLLGIFVNATIIGFNEEAQGIGILLLGVANGLLIFQMLRQRVSLFS